MLTIIKEYNEKHRNNIIIATGDTNQLESVAQLSNKISYGTYSNHCIDTIFSNNIYITINKRLKSVEDREILKQFKLYLFNKNIPIKTTIANNFKMVDNIFTNNNIALRNEICENVSRTIRNINKTDDYEARENFICRTYLESNNKSKSMKLNVNYEYVISQVNDTDLVITDNTTNESYTVPIKSIKANFIHGYGRTCHSLQGSSISREIYIFDWELF